MPELIKRDTDWVNQVMSSVSHSPFSRIKSIFADITADEARAKGYVKGNLKMEEVITTLRRVTTPVTIYKSRSSTVTISLISLISMLYRLLSLKCVLCLTKKLLGQFWLVMVAL